MQFELKKSEELEKTASFYKQIPNANSVILSNVREMTRGAKSELDIDKYLNRSQKEIDTKTVL